MRHLFLVSTFLISLNSYPQGSFKGNYINKELNLRFDINLYEPSIPQPQFEEDSCYGVLSGALNGRWVILKVTELEDDKAIVRAVSDSGVEAQTLEIKAVPDAIEIRQTGSTNIRGVKNSKYTKLPKTIILNRNNR